MRAFFLAVAVLLLSGCGNHEIHNEAEVTYEIRNEAKIRRFEFEGHTYIWFKRLHSGYSGGIVHDPDCQCMIEYD